MYRDLPSYCNVCLWIDTPSLSISGFEESESRNKESRRGSSSIQGAKLHEDSCSQQNERSEIIHGPLYQQRFISQCSCCCPPLVNEINVYDSGVRSTPPSLDMATLNNILWTLDVYVYMSQTTEALYMSNVSRVTTDDWDMLLGLGHSSSTFKWTHHIWVRVSPGRVLYALYRLATAIHVVKQLLC